MRKKDLCRFLIVSIVLLATMKLSFDSQAIVAEGLSMTGLKTRIETRFFQESIAFYSQHLGMTVLESWDENGDKGVILGLGSSAEGEAFLELAYVETRRTFEGISLQFRVHDLGVFVDRLRGHLEFHGPEERPWGSKYLYLEDPTGVQVILYEGEL